MTYPTSIVCLLEAASLSGLSTVSYTLEKMQYNVDVTKKTEKTGKSKSLRKIRRIKTSEAGKLDINTCNWT